MNNNYPEELLPIPPKVELLGVMSAIIYASMPHKDNGYAVINAVGQARELLTEVNKQTTV
jgi:hypothetical protein